MDFRVSELQIYVWASLLTRHVDALGGGGREGIHLSGPQFPLLKNEVMSR